MTELEADCTGRYGYMSVRDLEFLRWAAHSPVVGALLNVGCFRGLSCSVLATVAAGMNAGPLICIDPFEPWYDPLVQSPPQPASYEEWDANMRQCGVRQFIVHHRVRSDKALPLLQERGVKLRLAFVDGSHLYDDIRGDLEGVWPLLVPGGLLVMDDWLGGFDVQRACRAFRGDHWAPCGDKMAFAVKPG